MNRTDRAAIVLGALFALAFALSVVMLVTDQNLRTDFGTISSGYYAHWYVVLVTAVADAAGAALLWTVRERRTLVGGTIGAGLLVAVFLGDILTYSQVGFSSASQFAQYLFGITYYGGNIRYLYDAVLAVYVVAFAVGLASVLLSRRSGVSSEPPPTSP